VLGIVQRSVRGSAYWLVKADARQEMWWKLKKRLNVNFQDEDLSFMRQIRRKKKRVCNLEEREGNTRKRKEK
jgi:hypothetical protein